MVRTQKESLMYHFKLVSSHKNDKIRINIEDPPKHKGYRSLENLQAIEKMVSFKRNDLSWKQGKNGKNLRKISANPFVTNSCKIPSVNTTEFHSSMTSSLVYNDITLNDDIRSPEGQTYAALYTTTTIYGSFIIGGKVKYNCAMLQTLCSCQIWPQGLDIYPPFC